MMTNVDSVKLLLTNTHIDPSADNNLIRWASRYGRTEVVKLLLADERVDPTADNNYAIRMASEYDHTEVVRLLLADERVDPTADNNYAIREASSCGYIDVVTLLLSKHSGLHTSCNRPTDVNDLLDKLDPYMIPDVAKLVCSYVTYRCPVRGCPFMY